MFDYLLVGTGLFNAVFAYEAKKKGKTCIAIDCRNHIGGNVYTREQEGIQIHEYGAHIFRTSNKEIWEYMSQFAEFNHFVNSPIANYKGEIYNLPFNMNTFSKLWGIRTPEEAAQIIKEQSGFIKGAPRNLEEHAVSLVGQDVYEKFIKGYTEKQWGRPCTELPKEIMRRIPVRFTYDNNYFNDPYQGIPIGGYTKVIEKMFEGCKIHLNCDFVKEREKYMGMAKEVIYTGTIDGYFEYCYGPLEYRSLRFETEVLDAKNYQGVAVVNYTDAETPYTRMIEHKHFEFGMQDKTVVTKEYPLEWNAGIEPYYPINDEKNTETFEKYKALGDREQNVHFGGRLGEYKYYDMQDTVASALKLSEKIM